MWKNSKPPWSEKDIAKAMAKYASKQFTWNQYKIMKQEPIKEPMECWYYDVDRQMTYWLANPTILSTPYPIPPPHPGNLDLRTFNTNLDLISHKIEGPNGASWWYVIPVTVSSKAQTSHEEHQKNYPENPDLNTLSVFMAKYNLTNMILNPSGPIAIIKETTRDFEDNRITLNVGGHSYLKWVRDNTYFYIPYIEGDPTYIINTFLQYAGKKYSYELRDGVWGIIPQKDKWFPLHNGMCIQNETGLVTPSANCEGFLERDHRIYKMVDDYMETINAKRILDATGTMTPNNTIFYRCKGCAKSDGTHMKMHIQRGDLSLFIIESAYHQFGKAAPAKALWMLIDSVKANGNASPLLPEFKETLRKFLLDCVLPKGLFLRPTPEYGQFASRNWRASRWRHSSIKNGEDDLPEFVSAPSPLAHGGQVGGAVLMGLDVGTFIDPLPPHDHTTELPSGWLEPEPTFDPDEEPYWANPHEDDEDEDSN